MSTTLHSIRKFAMAGLTAIALFTCNAMAKAGCVSGQYDTFTQGNYLIMNNEWGYSNGAGWQQVCSCSTSSNSWSANWWWPYGNGQIKAYPSIVRGWHWGTWSPSAGGFPVLVSNNAPMPTSVSYGVSGNNKLDVSYDIFFSSSTNPSSPSGELMVWLQCSGLQPAGSKVASGVTLGGMSGTWDVWKGDVGWPVWSFVRTSQVTSFSANLQPFVYYVAYTKGWLSKSWYVLDIEFGTEIVQSNGSNGSISISSYSASAN